MKALRQDSVSISPSPAARSCAGPRPTSGVSGYQYRAWPATRRAPWPITESDQVSGPCVADQLPNERRVCAGNSPSVVIASGAQINVRMLIGGHHCDLGPGSDGNDRPLPLEIFASISSFHSWSASWYMCWNIRNASAVLIFSRSARYLIAAPDSTMMTLWGSRLMRRQRQKPLQPFGGYSLLTWTRLTSLTVCR